MKDMPASNIGIKKEYKENIISCVMMDAGNNLSQYQVAKIDGKYRSTINDESILAAEC